MWLRNSPEAMTHVHYLWICMIIQLTPKHPGLSVTNYIKYYAYLYYLLSLDYLSLQQLWYYFPNYVYPNPRCQLSLWEETGEKPRLSAERWQTLFTWDHTWVHSETRTQDLRGERRFLWPLRLVCWTRWGKCSTLYPHLLPVHPNMTYTKMRKSERYFHSTQRETCRNSVCERYIVKYCQSPNYSG